VTDLPPRYRDYITQPPGQPSPAEPDPTSQDSTVVMKMRDGTWYAILQRQGAASALDEFTGTRQDAIDWARQRARECWVYSEELGDVVLLEAGDTEQN
jgi:hypothetical protein